MKDLEEDDDQQQLQLYKQDSEVRLYTLYIIACLIVHVEVVTLHW